MMNLLSLVWQNLIRNSKSLLFSSIGLVVGVSTFVFFVSLGEGVKTVVLERIFMIRQVEVVPRSFDLAVTQTSVAKLDDAALDRLDAIDGVVAVFPKQKFTFPSWVTGGEAVLGKKFRAEAIVDGVPPAIVRSELEHGDMFRDWEAEFTCEGEGLGATAGCPQGRRCIEGLCQKVSCNPNVDERYSPCQGDTYCAEDSMKCEMPIPVIINPALLALYNSSLTTALSAGEGANLPKLTEDAFVGLTFEFVLGKSYLGKSAQGEPMDRWAKVVGFSDKAIQLGMTIPIQYVKRYNARFTDAELRNDYHSVLLEAESNDKVAAITKAVVDMGYDLDAKHAQAERFGLVITIVTLLFTLISLLIVGVSAVNIAHTFLMIIAERRREIGILRALGANRGHIRNMILGEAVLLGITGGSVGVAVGYGMSHLVDWIAAHYVPDFPFKPETFFIFEGTVLGIALVASVFFCLVGAYIPARRAANMEPAQAFTTQ